MDKSFLSLARKQSNTSRFIYHRLTIFHRQWNHQLTENQLKVGCTCANHYTIASLHQAICNSLLLEEVEQVCLQRRSSTNQVVHVK